MPIPLHAIPCRPQNRCGGGCAGVMGPRCESRYPAETPRPVGAADRPRNPESRTSPVTPTTRQLPGLRAPVDLWRDAWGIAHLRARGADDAFFALGHVHASDRLWQMDALRRRTLGRYAEWLGPSALPMDMLARRLGLTECCCRDLLVVNDDTRAMLAAYTAGVNAFIATGPPPPEYALLGATPEPWPDWHCIAVLRQTSLLLNSVYPKLWRAIALPIVGAAALDGLRMNDGSDDLACMPPGASADRIAPDMAALADAMAAFTGHSDTEASPGGSNNWALHGSRTRSGRPLLAGDPHRVLDMPNLYLHCHVACDEFDVIGLPSPGVPGFPHFAHNRDVAWCVTVAFVDTADLYLERFEDQGRRYLLRTDADGGNAQWAEVARRVERIRVRGQADVDCEVLVTARGPVVAGAANSGSALVLRHSSDVEADRSFDCLRPMMQARSVAALFEASRGWGLVDHNLVAADTQGHIGHHVRAKIPRRPAANGWLPVPGWLDRHAWRGWLAWEQLPRQIDPAAGLIVTANNRIVERHDEYLSTDCHPPHRARRISQLLPPPTPPPPPPHLATADRARSRRQRRHARRAPRHREPAGTGHLRPPPPPRAFPSPARPPPPGAPPPRPPPPGAGAPGRAAQRAWRPRSGPARQHSPRSRARIPVGLVRAATAARRRPGIAPRRLVERSTHPGPAGGGARTRSGVGCAASAAAATPAGGGVSWRDHACAARHGRDRRRQRDGVFRRLSGASGHARALRLGGALCL